MTGERVAIVRGTYGSDLNAWDGVAYVTVVNVPGTSEPTDAEPAAMLEAGQSAGGSPNPILVPLSPPGTGLIGPMFGGTYAELGYGAFRAAVAKLVGVELRGAIPIHDRFETQAQYDLMSR